MTGKYLNPKADLTFKLVFGEHPDLVMSLLNALLPLSDDEQIQSMEYLTPATIYRLCRSYKKGREAERHDTARKMKERGLGISLIAEITGLSEAEIEGL